MEIAGRFHGVVVDAADGVAQEQHMVGGTGEGHGEQHRPEPGEPVLVEARDHIRQPGSQHPVGIIQEQVAGHQRHAGVDQRGHVAQPQYLRALDVEVLSQEHDTDAHEIHRDDQRNGQLQGVPYIAGHVARKEEADHGQRVGLAVCTIDGEDLRDGVQAGKQHEAEEQIHEKGDAEDLPDVLRLQP